MTSSAEHPRFHTNSGPKVDKDVLKAREAPPESSGWWGVMGCVFGSCFFPTNFNQVKVGSLLYFDIVCCSFIPLFTNDCLLKSILGVMKKCCSNTFKIMEPKNTSLEKEEHLPTQQFLGFKMLVFLAKAAEN